MKRFFKFAISLLLVLLLSGIIIVIGAWLWSTHKGGAPDIPPEVKVTPKNVVPLGGDVIATLDFKLPIHYRLLNITVEPSPGMLLVGKPKLSWVWEWHKKRYHMNALFRPFKSGEQPSGVIKIHISPWNKSQKSEIHKVSIPEVNVKPESNVFEKLQLADEYKTPLLPSWLHWLWAILIIPVAILIWKFFHRKKPEFSISLTQQTKLSLTALRYKLINDKVSPELIFIELTDLMKVFLEKRFNLSSSRETTQEFMSKLERIDSLLPDKYHPFLRDFLSVADLVKFAKLPPEITLLDKAINKAEELVDFTSTDEEKKEQ